MVYPIIEYYLDEKMFTEFLIVLGKELCHNISWKNQHINHILNIISYV